LTCISTGKRILISAYLQSLKKKSKKSDSLQLVVQLDHGQSFQDTVQPHIVQLSDQMLWPKKMFADKYEITPFRI
jgi:hypothetical protein